MKNARKIWSLIACFTLLCMLLSSCSPTKPVQADKAPAPKIVLSFISNWGGSSPYADLVQKSLDEFITNNPNVEIINESVSDEDYINKLKANFASGYTPDIFCLWPGYDMDNLISSGQVANITQAAKEMEERFLPGALDGCARNGRYFGIPFESAYVALYVNKSLLSDYGLSVPSTYEELKSAISVLRSSNIDPIAYSGHYEGSLLYQAIIASLPEEQTENNPSVNTRYDKRYIDSMRVLKELYDLEAFPQKAFTMNGHEENNEFLSGKAAMIVQGSWFSGYLDQLDAEVAIINFPNPTGTQQSGKLIFNNSYGSLHISAQAIKEPEKQKAALDFLDYFTSQQVVQRFVNEKGMISAILLTDDIYASNPFAQKGLDLITGAKEYIPFPSEEFGDAVWNDGFVKRFPYMLENRVVPEQLYDQALNMTDSY